MPLRDGRICRRTAAILRDHRVYVIQSQYGYGPRCGAIEDYLTVFMTGERNKKNEMRGVRLGVVLRNDAIHGCSKCHHSVFGVYDQRPGVRQADKKAGRALSDVLDAPLPSGLHFITMRLTSEAHRDSRLDREETINIIENLRQFGPEVRRLFAVTKAGERGRTEQTDLLVDRLEVDSNLTAGRDHRYTQLDRWDALGNYFEEWRANGELPAEADLAA